MTSSVLNTPYHHTYQSLITKWYRTIDPVILTCCLMLLLIGGILIASGGGAVATRIGISGNTLSAEWWFFLKHSVFVMTSVCIMLI